MPMVKYTYYTQQQGDFMERPVLETTIAVSCELIGNKAAYDDITPAQACKLIKANTGIDLDQRQLRERVWAHMPEDTRPNILFRARGRYTEKGSKRPTQFLAEGYLLLARIVKANSRALGLNHKEIDLLESIEKSLQIILNKKAA